MSKKINPLEAARALIKSLNEKFPAKSEPKKISPQEAVKKLTESLNKKINEYSDLQKADKTKHDRCVEAVKQQSPKVDNPHAVCVAAGVKPEKWKKSEESMEKDELCPTSKPHPDLKKWMSNKLAKQMGAMPGRAVATPGAAPKPAPMPSPASLGAKPAGITKSEELGKALKSKEIKMKAEVEKISAKNLESDAIDFSDEDKRKLRSKKEKSAQIKGQVVKKEYMEKGDKDSEHRIVFTQSAPKNPHEKGVHQSMFTPDRAKNLDPKRRSGGLLSAKGNKGGSSLAGLQSARATYVKETQKQKGLLDRIKSSKEASGEYQRANQAAKETHKRVIAEQKEMPKPNLPKSEYMEKAKVDEKLQYPSEKKQARKERKLDWKGTRGIKPKLPNDKK